MKVLMAYEKSGIGWEAFSSRGHDVISCDLLPSDRSKLHVVGDIFTYMEFCNKTGFRFDLIIAHPVCTYLCNSGVRWLYNPDGSINTERWNNMTLSAESFRKVLDFPADMVVAENPIPHKYALDIIGRKYDQIVQPHQFGHGETKATCLWLSKGMPKLKPTNNVPGREARIHKMAPGPNRTEKRSESFPGIMKAMADQWGINP